METSFPHNVFEMVWNWIPEGLVQAVPSLKMLRAKAATRYANRGQAAHTSGHLDAAIAEYSKAVRLEPDRYEYPYEIGRIFYEQNSLKEAEHYFRRALNVNFSYSNAIKGLGYTLHRLGSIDEAIYCYSRYLDADPSDQDVHANLIAALEANGKYEEAVAAGDRAIARCPGNAGLLFMLARNNYFTGRIEVAISQLKQALEWDPKNADMYRVLGIALKTQGDINGALANFQQAVAHNPSDADAYLAVADVYRQLGRNNDYLEAARQARMLFETSHNDLSLKYACWEEGWALYMLGRWKESIEASECALRIDPKLSPVRFNLGLALLRLGALDRAKQEYEKALETAEATTLKLDAIDDLTAALEADPNLPYAKEILRELETRYRNATADQENKLAERLHAAGLNSKSA